MQKNILSATGILLSVALLFTGCSPKKEKYALLEVSEVASDVPAQSEGAHRVRRVVNEKKEEPFRVIEEKDPSLRAGERQVLEKGENGLSEVTYLITFEDGKEIRRVAQSERILRQARPERVLVGTKGAKESESDGEPASSAARRMGATSAFVSPPSESSRRSESSESSRRPARSSSESRPDSSSPVRPPEKSDTQPHTETESSSMSASPPASSEAPVESSANTPAPPEPPVEASSETPPSESLPDSTETSSSEAEAKPEPDVPPPSSEEPPVEVSTP